MYNDFLLVSQLLGGNYTSSNIYNIVLMPSAQALWDVHCLRFYCRLQCFTTQRPGPFPKHQHSSYTVSWWWWRVFGP